MAGVAAQLRDLDSGTAVMLLRMCNLVCGLLGLGVAGCWHVYHIVGCSDEVVDGQDAADGDCMSFFGKLSSAVVALYIIPLSALLLMFELSRGKTDGRVRNWLECNTGFIFLYTRRYQFLIFLGILICGNASDNNSPEWFTMTVGVLLLVNAVLHIVVRKQHPDWDTKMIEQLEEAAARRAAGGSVGRTGPPSTGFGPTGGMVPPPMPSGGQQAHAPRGFDSIAPPARRATTPPRNFGGTPPASGSTAI